LGLNCSSWHDPSAALMIDGELVAAAEEERFCRRKHARDTRPADAVRFCLERAGVRPEDVTVVAHPWSMKAVRDNFLPYIRSNLGQESPVRVARFLRQRPRRRRRELRKLHETLNEVGIDPARARISEVEHHLAHAASAYLFSGFGDCELVTIDGAAEMTSGLFGSLRGGRLTKLHEIQRPASLGIFYSAITDYLGFSPDDGEYKVMGMAPYGDPDEIDLSDLIRWDGEHLRMNRDFIFPPNARRYQGRRFGQALVDRFGPPRTGDVLAEPYIHIAAATQRLLERVSLAMVENLLGDELRETGRLCFAGGCALNVVLNRKLIEHELVDELFVPPAPNDAGLSVGAAAYVAASLGAKVSPLRHAYLGPSYSTDDAIREFESRRIPYRRLRDPSLAGADLLARGAAVAWFQGSMEWGPRALGNRSILGHPGIPGMQREINARIKFRETWRPFCPTVLEEYASEVLGTTHPSPFMTYSFQLPQEWQKRLPEVTHVDGTARPQILAKETNPRFHALVSEFHRRTGLPVVINTSLNRRGEPMIRSPYDALEMFYGCGLEHLIIEDVYACKDPSQPAPLGVAV
jgi:carbamoyltransferase